jgi:hypothetical protein
VGVDIVGVEVPTSRFWTEIRGSMNLALYSERTWVWRAVLFFCCVVEKFINKVNCCQPHLTWWGDLDCGQGEETEGFEGGFGG